VLPPASCNVSANARSLILASRSEYRIAVLSNVEISKRSLATRLQRTPAPGQVALEILTPAHSRASCLSPNERI
jgi:predicted house-cleaning NTP pyrophosphatase (Maf/HAM1 superfamily)